MRRTRFSIGSLMGFVLIVALGIGGLKNASPLWASACYSLAFAGLVAGVLFAVQSRARTTAFRFQDGPTSSWSSSCPPLPAPQSKRHRS
jgi:hypothetical protein